MRNMGLIGLGMVAGYGHLPALAASKDWNLAAIADTNADRLAKVAADHPGAKPYGDYRALLAHPNLEAVAVATHLDSHHTITVEALRRGLHVLCEKPMASTAAQCREMVDAARISDRLLVINFNGRSGGVYPIIKQRIDAGDVGRVRVVRIAYAWSAHQWQPAERMENFMRSGGPVMDSAVHFFEATRWFTGQDFTRIDAHGAFNEPYENPVHVIASCTLNGGAVALIEAGWIYCKTTKDRGQIFTFDVIGDDGAISWDALSNKMRIYTRTDTKFIDFADQDKGFPFVYERFARSIEQGRVIDLASGEDGMKATEAAIMALASAKRGR